MRPRAPAGGAPPGGLGRFRPDKNEDPAFRPGLRRTTTSWSPLGQVVADVAEDVLELAAEEDHGNDDRNGDNSDDEGVLDEALAIVLTEESEHSVDLPSCVLGTRTDGRRRSKF